MNKDFLRIQKTILDTQENAGCDKVQGTYTLQMIMRQFMMEGIDEFMKFLPKEDRERVLELAYEEELSFTDNLLNNYIQDYWTHNERYEGVS